MPRFLQLFFILDRYWYRMFYPHNFNFSRVTCLCLGVWVVDRLGVDIEVETVL